MVVSITLTNHEDHIKNGIFVINPWMSPCQDHKK